MQHQMMEAAFVEAQQANMEAAFMEANPQFAMEQAFQEVTAPPVGDQWAEEFAQEQMDAADLAQAAQMVATLRASGNPKLANSQFVSFIDKVAKGDLKFEQNSVVDRAGQEV